MWGRLLSAICATFLLIGATSAAADAKWIKPGQDNRFQPQPELSFLERLLLGAIADGQLTPPGEPAWVHTPTRRKIIVGVPVINGPRPYRRALSGNAWTPYDGYAVRTQNGFAISRPQRSVSGSLRNSKVGGKIRSKFR